jgi:hypothetical protein
VRRTKLVPDRQVRCEISISVHAGAGRLRAGRRTAVQPGVGDLFESAAGLAGRARTARVWITLPASEPSRSGSIVRQLAGVARAANRAANARSNADAGKQRRAHRRVVGRSCDRGAREIAAARVRIAGLVEVERAAVDRARSVGERAVGRELAGQRSTGPLAVALDRLEVERLLVAERGIQARPVHLGRRREVVERRPGVPGAPERSHRGVERALGVIGARPAAASGNLLYRPGQNAWPGW